LSFRSAKLWEDQFRKLSFVYLYKTYYAKLSTSLCFVSIVKKGHLLLPIFGSPHEKKRETQNNVVLSNTLLLLLPLNVQQGKINFLFFYFVSSYLALSLSLPPTHPSIIKTQNPMQPIPSHDENTRGVTPCKRLPIGHLTRHRGRVGWSHSPYAIMG